MEKVNLRKQVYPKSEVNNVIDTNFTEFTLPNIQTVVTASVEEFFTQYQTLFYQIPKFGDTDSHQYLVITSQEYIGSEAGGNEVIDALIAEITALRQENLDLQQQLAQNTTTTVQDALKTLQNLNG